MKQPINVNDFQVTRTTIGENCHIRVVHIETGKKMELDLMKFWHTDTVISVLMRLLLQEK